MKNILLPTDFSVQSLWPVHDIVRHAGGQRLCIEVVHMLNMPTGITDLFSIRQQRPEQAIPAAFKEAFQLLCHKYRPVIEKMQVRFIYGSTAAVLNNHISGRNIHEAYLLDNYQYTTFLPQSINMAGLLQQGCKVPLYRLPLHAGAFSEYQILSALLGSENPAEAPRRTVPRRQEA